MAVVKPDVVIISSDDDSSDGEGGFVREPHVVLIISSDDEVDGERNLEEDEGFVSEQDVEINQLDKDECIHNNNNINCNHGFAPSIQGGSDLHALSHNECKTYLLKRGMRVSGTKEECILRIKEHERLKDVGGESLYPRSSFSINCTGDACRGDVVLFKQNLYNSQRKLIGRRTVAGRIANESYGATTQNHTFTVEVLWSKRFKQLDPLSVLLVQGCNLYRFGTFRQPWENEAERLKVLEEKHERGKEARRKRKLRETEFASGSNKGTKRRKVFHGVPSQSKHVTGLCKNKHVNKNSTESQAVLFQNEELKGSTKLTRHSDPNCSMHSEHHIQEASLPFTNDRTLLPNNLLPFGSSGCSHHSNEQGPSQTSQSPDHHDHNSELSVDRSKDEKAKLQFPISSFSINCTGDARERDIVLFKQQVYCAGKSEDKKRTVAGRIVKVRQCEARDKHRFVIKVLWTIPYMENFRRSTLLVRSRNLYKFGTFRQPWKNEAMTSQMLEEQHKPALFKRKLKKADIALNKNKGVKRQRVSHNGPSSSKQPTQVVKHKFSKKKGASASPHKKKVQKMKMKNSKQTFHSNPNPNMNLNPSQSINPNVNPNSDPISCTTSNPNLIPSTTLIPISNTTSNLNPISSITSNPNPISSTTSNPNLISSATSNPDPISSTTSNPNLSPYQNQNPSTRQNKPNARPNPKARQNGKAIARQNGKPNARQNQNLNARQNKKPKFLSNPNARQNGKSNAHQRRNLNVCNSQNLNAHQNGKPNARHSRNLNACENKKPNALPDPNAHQNGKTKACQSRNLNDRQNWKLSARQSQDLNAHRNPNPRQNLNPNTHQNRNLYDRHNQDPSTSHNQDPSTSQNPCQNSNQNPNPNSFVYGGQQLLESSLSVSYHRSFMPYPPPVWFPLNQQPLPLGYGGQWGHNHAFIQPPNYNYVAAQLLVSRLYQQPL